MGSLIDTLYDQHRRMFTLLALLEREVAAFAEGKAFDPYIVEGTLDYVAEYPDRLHRPIEIKVYDAFRRAKGGEDPLSTAAAASEHEGLGAAAREVRNAIAAVSRGAAMPRDWVVDKARRLIDGLRAHMAHEEETILPACRAELSQEALVAIKAEIEADTDIPAIVAEENAYTSLYETIAAQDRMGLAAD
jgi:hemerythrin-like domain-containing protein